MAVEVFFDLIIAAVELVPTDQDIGDLAVGREARDEGVCADEGFGDCESIIRSNNLAAAEIDNGEAVADFGSVGCSTGNPGVRLGERSGRRHGERQKTERALHSLTPSGNVSHYGH
ncbi:MAG: hypothetical protein HC888_14240 [Candidatus Competibacteraceae bacterium]|nr:hypothetical protein [Candidatus Competibacteraceae bacterium]